MTYYLDQDINIELNVITASYFRQNTYTIYKGEDVVFKGTTYIKANSGTVVINCNDVVSTYRPNYTTSSTGEYPLSETFRIVLDDSLSSTSEVEFEVVYMYRYPNKQYDYNLEGLIILGDLIPHFPITEDVYFNSKDLWNYSTAPVSNGINRFPSSEDGKCIIRKVDKSEFAEGVDKIVADVEISYILYATSIEAETSTLDTLMSIGLSREYAIELINKGEGIIRISADRSELESIQTYLQSERIETEIRQDITGKPIAYIDKCPARYYLKWIDRKGGIQCQAFKNKDIFSEDIVTQTIRNFTGHIRKVFWDVKSKWTINTDWLSDAVYPIYESIFLSPYLELIDTKEGLVHKVLVTNDSFVEKNFSNQKQMFNMTLNLEADKNQNIYN